MALDVISKGLGHKHSVTFGVINGVTSAIQRTKVTLTVTLKNGTGILTRMGTLTSSVPRGTLDLSVPSYRVDKNGTWTKMELGRALLFFA